MPVGDNYYVRRRAEMSRMRERGISILEIGRRFDISKQRVSQILGNTGYLSVKIRHTALVDKIRALSSQYRRGEISGYELSSEAGCDYTTAMKIIGEMGLGKKAIRAKFLTRGKGYCSECHKFKPFNELTRDRSRVSGYNLCRKCNTERSKAYYWKERNAGHLQEG